MRRIKYVDAIREGLNQLLSDDKKVFMIGVGVNSPWYMGMSTKGLYKKFGKERIIDIPISENCITGMGVGAAMTGMKPIVTHPRMDFMWYAMDPIVNHASSAHYMFGGKIECPVTVRAIINRGGEQGAQHSQALQGVFNHIPGLKVVMPSNAYDAKGLLIASVKDKNPVIFIEDRWLYQEEAKVPKKMYQVPIGKGVVRQKGKDLTIVATSYVSNLTLKVVKDLSKEKGLSIEVIDPRTIKPLDKKIIFDSLNKTKNVLIIDAGWRTNGFASEVAAVIAENDVFKNLERPIKRLTLPDCHAPASAELEKHYYLSKEKIKKQIIDFLG